jgi:hypothetical protein
MPPTSAELRLLSLYQQSNGARPFDVKPKSSGGCAVG